MPFSLFVLGVSTVAFSLAFLFRNSLLYAAQNIYYGTVYWALGSLYSTHDHLYQWRNKLKERPKRKDDVAIITGGARGIGVEIVKILLECEITVIVACRNVKAGLAMEENIRKEGLTMGKIDVMKLDVSSLMSIREFAKNFLVKYPKLHLLINNAGIMNAPLSYTEDGFENHLATNYIGHALLTHLLLPALVKGGEERDYHARVVNVSSCAHIPAEIFFDDLHCKKSIYAPLHWYGQSKLAQIMFSSAIERRLREKHLPVSSFSVHPGIVDTDLFQDTVLKATFPWIITFFFKSPKAGAISIAYVAISNEIEGKGGIYLSNCGEHWVSRNAADKEQQEKVVLETEKMLKVDKLCVLE